MTPGQRRDVARAQLIETVSAQVREQCARICDTLIQRDAQLPDQTPRQLLEKAADVMRTATWEEYPQGPDVFGAAMEPLVLAERQRCVSICTDVLSRADFGEDGPLREVLARLIAGTALPPVPKREQPSELERMALRFVKSQHVLTQQALLRDEAHRSDSLQARTLAEATYSRALTEAYTALHGLVLMAPDP